MKLVNFSICSLIRLFNISFNLSTLMFLSTYLLKMALVKIFNVEEIFQVPENFSFSRDIFYVFSLINVKTIFITIQD